MADAELCQRVRCGALSQTDIGEQALYECSRDGYVGVLGCSHPECQPYLDELRAAGVCPDPEAGRVAELLPLHPPEVPDEGERPRPPVRFNLPVMEPRWGEGRGLWCQAMAWVDIHPCLAVGLVMAGWWVLRGRGR